MLITQATKELTKAIQIKSLNLLVISVIINIIVINLIKG